MKNAWLLFHCKSFIVVLSLYICTLFYFHIEKNTKERQGKKLIRRKMYSAGFKLTSPGCRGQCSHHCAIEVSQFSDSIFPIYRQPIFIINLNTDTTVSRQSELLSCLPTVLTHEEFRLFHTKKRRICQNELARLADALCPLSHCI